MNDSRQELLKIISSQRRAIVEIFYSFAHTKLNAQMVKLVDTPAWGAGARKGVQVRVLFWAL